MSNSVKKNLGLQTVYQILNTCLPLITAPYLARVLGAKQLGVFSYTSSVVAYFTLIAMLGTVNYGTRCIASTKDKIFIRSKMFWEIYALQVIMSFSAIIIYIFYLMFFCHSNKCIAFIQLIALLSCVFDISWLFFGLENFEKTVTVSMLFRILTVIFILVFVKSAKDLWIYTLLMLVGTLLGQLVLWIYIPRYIKFVKISLKGIIYHLKPNLVLFIPLLAMSVYHTMDKTMLGMLSNYQQSGFYYNADKIINIPLCVINGVGTVMLPRMTFLFNSKRTNEANQLFLNSIEGIAILGVAMSFGIAAISNEFVPFFFGDGYEACIVLIKVLSPVLIIKGVSNTVRTQYLVPMKLEKIFTKSVFIGALTNLIFNMSLIPRMGAMGAVIGTFFAEFVSCVWQFVYIRKLINIKKCLLTSCFYFIPGYIMYLVVRLVARISMPIIIKLSFEVGCGIFSFLSICIVFWKITHNELYKKVIEENSKIIRR